MTTKISPSPRSTQDPCWRTNPECHKKWEPLWSWGVPDHLKLNFAHLCLIFKTWKYFDMILGSAWRPSHRSLIGSYFGRKILLATSLIKWHLNHELEVIRICQVVEYTPITCFQPTDEAVFDGRRPGNVAPTKATIADTMKLVSCNGVPF